MKKPIGFKQKTKKGQDILFFKDKRKKHYYIIIEKKGDLPEHSMVMTERTARMVVTGLAKLINNIF